VRLYQYVMPAHSSFVAASFLGPSAKRRLPEFLSSADIFGVVRSDDVTVSASTFFLFCDPKFRSTGFRAGLRGRLWRGSEDMLPISG